MSYLRHDYSIFSPLDNILGAYVTCESSRNFRSLWPNSHRTGHSELPKPTCGKSALHTCLVNSEHRYGFPWFKKSHCFHYMNETHPSGRMLSAPLALKTNALNQNCDVLGALDKICGRINAVQKNGRLVGLE
jgi:hypothetical protein